MARLTQIGFESNSTTAGVEFDSITGSPTVQTTTVNGGTYALQCNVSATTAFLTHQYASTGNTNNTYFRAYIRFASFPTANNISILLIRSAAAGNNLIIHADTNGALSVTNEQAASVQVGNKTGGLRLNTWYRVELAYTYATGAVRAYLALGDGPATLFAQGTANASIDSNTLRAGFIDSATGNLFIDDIAINDNTGSNQTDIPGPGRIVHLKPSAAGDINGFTVQVGGTAGAANNFSRVQEVTPDDATSYNGAALLNAEDLFNVDNFTGGAFSSVNVVAVGVRMADLVAGDTTTGVKLEIEKTTAGTKSQSANLIPNSTSFLTNTATVPRNYPLVTYNDPDGVAWRQATLDSMQIGYINDTVGVQTVAISTVWVSVDFTPVQYGTTTSTSSTSASTFSTSSTSSSISSTSSSISTTSQSTSTSSTSTSYSITTYSTSSTSSSLSSTSSSSTSSSTSISSTSSSISSTSMSSTSQSSTSSSSSISSTSSSFSSTSSSVSSTSSSISSTSFSSTSSSSSTSTTTVPPPFIDYSYQDEGSFTTVQQFTPFSSTTWVCPANVTSVLVQCWGAGGGGGASVGTTGGSSGGGGGFSSSTISVVPGTIYSLQAGVGGAGGVSSAGSDGTDTWFKDTVTVLAKAGTGGAAGGGAAGVGGSSSLGVGTNTQTGGNGFVAVAAGAAGGGGGGGAGPNQNGITATSATGANGISLYGGRGGTGTVNGTAGNPGQAFGGGGGGSGAGTIGGTGAGGGIQLSYITNQNPQTTATSLISPFNAIQYGNVSVDDDDYFIERGSKYMIREYKKTWTNNTDKVTFTWKGRSTLSTLLSPMLMQIYNVNSATWETIANINTIPADTDFQVTATQSTNLSNYYDSNFVVAFRSYQQVI